jgi:pimeloyl-ACP methyl ester carboxylesterase
MLPKHKFEPRCLLRNCAKALLALFCFLVPSLWATDTAYRFTVGDSFTYSETFEREGTSQEFHSQTISRFSTQLLVLAHSGNSALLAFQRNRLSAELLKYEEKGRNKLQSETVAFNKRTAEQPHSYVDAAWMSSKGVAESNLAIVRESQSRTIVAVREIQPILSDLKSSGTWSANNPLPFTFRLLEPASANANSCAKVQGRMNQGDGTLQFTFCPKAGIIEELTFDSTYDVYGGSYHEVTRLKLTKTEHGGSVSEWLKSPETAEATLHAALCFQAVKLTSADLGVALNSKMAQIQAAALGLAWRRGLAVPGDTFNNLSSSADNEVRRIAELIAKRTGTPTPLDATRDVPTGTVLDVMRSVKLSGYPYIIHVPKEYRADIASPMIVYLSGGPGLAIDAANTGEKVLGRSEFLAVYPHAAGKMWWDEEPTKMVDELLKDLASRYNIDESRIYIVGFSNGGTGAEYYAGLWPKRFKKVVALMGAGDCMDEVHRMAKPSRVELLLAHGEDDPIIPKHCSEDYYRAFLKSSPLKKPELHILKKRGHDITLASDDGLTMTFLRSP